MDTNKETTMETTQNNVTQFDMTQPASEVGASGWQVWIAEVDGDRFWLLAHDEADARATAIRECCDGGDLSLDDLKRVTLRGWLDTTLRVEGETIRKPLAEAAEEHARGLDGGRAVDRCFATTVGW